jgi:hypothetical protein
VLWGPPGSDDFDVCIVISVGHHVWRHSPARWTCGRLGSWDLVSACFLRGGYGGAACHLPSITTSPDGGGGGMMDALRVVEPSGVMGHRKESSHGYCVDPSWRRVHGRGR